MKRNQAHHYPTLAHAHPNKNKTSKTSQAQKKKKKKKRYLFSLLGRKYVVLQLLSKCFDIRDNLISLGKEFQKPGPDVFTPLDAKFVLFFVKL